MSGAASTNRGCSTTSALVQISDANQKSRNLGCQSRVSLYVNADVEKVVILPRLRSQILVGRFHLRAEMREWSIALAAGEESVLPPFRASAGPIPASKTIKRKRATVHIEPR